MKRNPLMLTQSTIFKVNNINWGKMQDALDHAESGQIIECIKNGKPYATVGYISSLDLELFPQKSDLELSPQKRKIILEI